METTIIEFLFGLVAGTIAGLLIVKRTGNKTTTPRKTLRTTKPQVARPKAVSRQVKARNPRSRRLNRLPARTQQQLVATVPGSSPPAPASQTAVLSCPACGLQAPESLMAEHFLGSPSHKNGPIKLEPAKADNVIQRQSEAIRFEEDSMNSLRHLLQMLVPPRAFGRRHEQKSINPLSMVVQTIGERRNPVA